jgi:hypothetical protein
VHRYDAGGRGQGRRRSNSRILIGAAVLGASAVALAGCSSLSDTANTSDAKPVSATTSAPPSASAAASSASGDSGCTSALHDISTYGPSTLKLLADGREALNKASVQLLVDGLDLAADAANSPRAKQDIQNVANDYDDYFNLTTEAQTIPLSTLLKDTADLKFVCG